MTEEYCYPFTHRIKVIESTIEMRVRSVTGCVQRSIGTTTNLMTQLFLKMNEWKQSKEIHYVKSMNHYHFVVAHDMNLNKQLLDKVTDLLDV